MWFEALRYENIQWNKEGIIDKEGYIPGDAIIKHNPPCILVTVFNLIILREPE